MRKKLVFSHFLGILSKPFRKTRKYQKKENKNKKKIAESGTHD